MGDAGEGLIDADGRIQERMEELERDRSRQKPKAMSNPEHVRAFESLKLAKTELSRQLSATANERRRAQLTDAIKEVERRIAEAEALLVS